jgi:hypothetical protein
MRFYFVGLDAIPKGEVGLVTPHDPLSFQSRPRTVGLTLTCSICRFAIVSIILGFNFHLTPKSRGTYHAPHREIYPTIDADIVRGLFKTLGMKLEELHVSA